MSVKLTEVRNPAAVGWRWTSDETEYELCWIRGGYGLTLGVKRDGRWITTSVSNPERFLHTNTLAAAREAARKFTEV